MGANAVIPGQTILAIAAVIVAIAFFVTAFLGRWRYPLIGTALLVVSAIVVGAAIPWAVTTFQVRPNELTLESQYYQRNLDGTKAAYGIDKVEKENFQATTTAEAGQLRNDAESTAQLRIMDPAIIGPRCVSSSSTARTTSSPTRSTSTATRSTARRRTPSCRCAS